MLNRLLLSLTFLVLFTAAKTRVFAQESLLRPDDRVALLGGSFMERLQSFGALEAEVQCRKPNWKLRFRNIGWSGDDVHGIARKRFDQAEDGFLRVLQDIETADPTVVIVAYGFAEAADGVDAVKRFEPGLLRLIDEIAKTDRRIVLMTPVAMPGYRIVGFHNAVMQCRAIVRQVGSQLKLPVLSIDWQPSDTELNPQRLFPNAIGYASFSKQLADQLVGGEPSDSVSDEVGELIVRKNQLFFHRYRPQNETYLLLFRKHEQGNNAAEIPMFDPLIQDADEAIWAAAKPKE